jgi:hypothetical protein
MVPETVIVLLALFGVLEVPAVSVMLFVMLCAVLPV